jgi:ribosome modulation factor
MKESYWEDGGMEHRPVPRWFVITGIILSVLGLTLSGFILFAKSHNIDKEWATYQKGARAQQVGAPANANPYADETHRNLWLDGWLHAANVVDRTQLEPATTAPTGRQVSK